MSAKNYKDGKSEFENMQKPAATQLIKDYGFYNKRDKNLKEIFDEIFYYLPKNGGILMLFAYPVLKRYDYSFERYKEILSGEKPTDFEVSLFIKATQIAALAMDAYAISNKKRSSARIEDAVSAAANDFDLPEARKIVNSIYLEIEGFLGGEE